MFQRWVQDGDQMIAADARTTSVRPTPGNKLSEAEREQMLAVANSEEFASLPPSQIVPTLADRDCYLASESSFYRVLKQASQQHHRGRAKKPSQRVATSHCASGPNQVSSWDIEYIRLAGYSNGVCLAATLTQKGLAVLNSIPDSLSPTETIGGRTKPH
jgi:hypothetical protein